MSLAEPIKIGKLEVPTFRPFGNQHPPEATLNMSESAPIFEEFDLDPNNVQSFIRVEEGKFIVYIVHKSFAAVWKTLPSYDVPAGADGILARCRIIQAVPAEFPDDQAHLAFRQIVGAAMALALTGEVEAANETLNEAHKYVHDRAAETSRFWYIKASLFTTLGFVIFGVASEQLDWGWPMGDGSWQHMGLATMFGALGALYSFLSRLRGLSVDPAAGKQAHHQDAFLRIIIGALGAFIFAIGIKSRLVMGFLEQETDYSTWLFFLLCTAAGYSERLVPDFLQHVESKAVDD